MKSFLGYLLQGFHGAFRLATISVEYLNPFKLIIDAISV